MKIKPILKSLAVTLVLLAFTTLAQSPPPGTVQVYWNLTQMTGSANNRLITYWPMEGWVNFSNQFVSQIPRTANPVNGQATANLLPLSYYTRVEGIDYTFRFHVPSNGGPYNVWSLITNYTAATAPLPPLKAGANITLVTNVVNGQTQITVSSTGGSGGGKPTFDSTSTSVTFDSQ